MAFAIFIGGTFPQKDKALCYLLSCSTFFVADSGLSICDAYGIMPNLLIGDFDSVDKNLLLRYSNIPQKKFLKDKDFSDTELALKYASYFATLVDKNDCIEKLCSLDDNLVLSAKIVQQEELILVGGSGGRIDHLFAIKELFASNLHPNLWLTEENAIYCLEEGANYNILPAVFNAENDLTGNCSLQNNFASNAFADENFENKNFLDAPISFFCVASGAKLKNIKSPCIKSCGLEWELDDVAWQNGFASLSNRAKIGVNKIFISVKTCRFLCVLPLGMSCIKI